MNRILFLATACLFLLGSAAAEDEPAAQGDVPNREALLKQFEQTMSGATLVGYFTINGKEEQGLKEDKYHLKSVKKLKHGDFWQFEYEYGQGGKTIKLPPVEIKWAGDTPVITLSDVLVPGAGTFSARVLFYRHEYAGTWSASDHGGRMFGKVVPAHNDARAVEPAKPGGWISLFDGRSLAGWHTNPDKIGHGMGGRWTIEDRAIVGQQDPPGSGNGGILLTDREFGDFELTIEMKPDWGVDSGLFLRSNDKGQCFQMMVDYHEAGDVGHIYGEGTGGFNNRPYSLVGVYDQRQHLTRLTTKPIDEPPSGGYSASSEEWLKAWKVGDWNTARVLCVGQPPTITTWINGVKISEFNGQTFLAANYDQQKVADVLGRQGSIAVQVHGGKSWPEGAKCRWKNIRIRPL